MTRFARAFGYLFVGVGLAGFALGTTFYSAAGVTACGVVLLYLHRKEPA